MPPLDYALVYRLKAERPALEVVLNGGVPDLDAALGHLAHVDGVMLGRAAYHDPGLLGEADRRVFAAGRDMTPLQAVETYRPYMAEQLAAGTPLNAMTRHMLGLFAGQPGARHVAPFAHHGSAQARRGAGSARRGAGGGGPRAGTGGLRRSATAAGSGSWGWLRSATGG